MNCGIDNIKGTGLGKCLQFNPTQSLIEKKIIDKLKRESEFLKQTDLNHKIKTVAEVIKKQSTRQLF